MRAAPCITALSPAIAASLSVAFRPLTMALRSALSVPIRAAHSLTCGQNAGAIHDHEFLMLLVELTGICKHALTIASTPLPTIRASKACHKHFTGGWQLICWDGMTYKEEVERGAAGGLG